MDPVGPNINVCLTRHAFVKGLSFLKRENFANVRHLCSQTHVHVFLSRETYTNKSNSQSIFTIGQSNYTSLSWPVYITRAFN